MSEPNDDAMLSTQAAATFTGLAVATLAKMRCCGGGPKFFALGRKVSYRRSDLLEWLNLRRFSNTAEAALSVPRRLTDPTYTLKK
jgi:predicted DNA-binding transcriptional regulator AlpA